LRIYVADQAIGHLAHGRRHGCLFERKWQALPRFQQTRGILRLLALWVANAYQAGFKGAHKNPLIGMGTAPLAENLIAWP
jgi:hypothetical protein